ncbi:Acetyl-coenzyme A synthetase [Exaiptasia diaphana]|nr:Acetyl-coenzyme A synthetase [Exaiptasia diaphana]
MIASPKNSTTAMCDVPDLACIIPRVNPSNFIDNDKVVNEIKEVLNQKMLKAVVLVDSDADEQLLGHFKVHTLERLYGIGKENPESAANVRNAEAKVQMDDPCLVIFTSGSTSRSKPIEYTHSAYVNGVLANINCLRLSKDSIFFFDTVFDWVTGISFCIGSCIVQGLTYVAFPAKAGLDSNHLFTIVRIMAEESVTDANFRKHHLHNMAANKDEIQAMNLDIKLQRVSIGGEPTPPFLIKSFLEIWPNISLLHVYALYGSTEANLCLSQKINNDILDCLDNGAMDVVPGMEVKIVNKKGQLLPIGEAGEICVRSAWVSFCNWDYMNPDLEGRVDTIKKPNGWHSSKDVGVVVNQNCIRLLGRLDFMMKVAGDSIPPALVESKLQEHPDVKKVCVVGVPDDRL